MILSGVMILPDIIVLLVRRQRMSNLVLTQLKRLLPILSAALNFTCPQS